MSLCFHMYQVWSLWGIISWRVVKIKYAVRSWITVAYVMYISWPCQNHVRDIHDDVIKWKHFPRYWPFVREIHRSPVNSPHKGQWRGALMFSLICVWINGWVNNREAGDLRRYRAHCDVNVMYVRTWPQLAQRHLRQRRSKINSQKCESRLL